MKLRKMVQEKIRSYIENYDFEMLISDAFYNSNIDCIIEDKIGHAIDNMDFESIIEEAVEEIIEDEIEYALDDFTKDFKETLNKQI